MSRVKTKGGMAFQDDLILEATSLNEKFTEGQIAVLTKFLFPYVKHRIKDTHQHAIVFPFLGTFHMRVGQAKNTIKILKKWAKKNPAATRRFRERIRIISEQIANFETKYADFHEENSSGKRINSVHYKPKYFSMPAYKRGDTIEGIEKRILRIDNERRKFNF